MSDLLLSYSHEDQERVRPLADLLERQGWDTWWDREIPSGVAWESALTEALARTRAVLVVWSRKSRESQWVHREAEIGLEKNGFMQCFIDHGSVPDAFLKFQATDLTRWQGKSGLDEVQALIRRAASVVPPSRIDVVRPGFDREFLGADTPIEMPGVTGAAAVFRYLHFTVVMNPARRLAHYVAYNIDPESMQRTDKARMESRWDADPLLVDPLQVDRSILMRSEYDRGHIVSPYNVSWGDEQDAYFAVRQAFYFTNICPQARHVNRRTWFGVERMERALAKEYGRASGFSGPIFDDGDELFRDRIELEDGVIAEQTFMRPREFWKVTIVRTGEESLGAMASVVHEDATSNTSPLDFVVDLEEIERRAGIRISARLHEADPVLPTPGNP